MRLRLYGLNPKMEEMMKQTFDDIISLMLDELDQMVVEELRCQPDYMAYLNEYLALTEKEMATYPSSDLKRCILLANHILEMERRAALLKGMMAGTGFKQMFEGTNEQVLRQFLHSSFLLEAEPN